MIRDHHPMTRARSEMLRAANESAPLITRAEALAALGLEQLEQAVNATPAEQAALVELAVELGAPIACPSCGGAMGDGDRVTRGVCSMCTRRARRAGDR